MDYQAAISSGLKVAGVATAISLLFGIPLAYISSQHIFMTAPMRGILCLSSILFAPIMFIASVVMRIMNGPTHFFGLFPIFTNPSEYNLFRFYLEEPDVVAYKQILENNCKLKPAGSEKTVNEGFLDKCRAIGSIENVVEWRKEIDTLTKLTDSSGDLIGKKMLGT